MTAMFEYVFAMGLISPPPGVAPLAEEARMDVPWPSSSLHSLVMESYVRNRVPLPSSLASFTPKLQLTCPAVRPARLCQTGPSTRVLTRRRA